jgi:broad specificity phosphatase PhoE
MTIYLVRHTQYHNPENIFPFHLPVYLSADGREHAKRVAAWFAEQRLEKLPIFTSPIARCVQTAEIIAAKTDSFVATDARLVETYSPGIQGTTRPGKDDWMVEDDDPSRETAKSITDRVTSIFEEKKAEQQECILVSHGDPLTILYYHLLGKPLPPEMWNPQNQDLVISRGEIVKIEIKDNEYSLTRYKV